MQLLSGAATSAGRVRALNEDDFVAQAPVFVVADGMGGQAAGEVASALAVQAFRDLVGAGALSAVAVVETVARANERIHALALADPDRAGMGTTVCGLVAVEAAGLDHWVAFNVGDSRVYRFAQGELTQVSTDHSEVEELVGAGAITRSEARTHPRRNVITRSLGSDPAPRVDRWLVPPTAGERYVLCSDGLVTEVCDDDIAATLRGGLPPQEVADRLVELAVAAGGRDNVTVVVVDVLGADPDGLDETTLPRLVGA